MRKTVAETMLEKFSKKKTYYFLKKNPDENL